MIDAGDSQMILKWYKNPPENHYLQIAILKREVTLAVASLSNLKIQLRPDIGKVFPRSLFIDFNPWLRYSGQIFKFKHLFHCRNISYIYFFSTENYINQIIFPAILVYQNTQNCISIATVSCWVRLNYYNLITSP